MQSKAMALLLVVALGIGFAAKQAEAVKKTAPALNPALDIAVPAEQTRIEPAQVSTVTPVVEQDAAWGSMVQVTTSTTGIRYGGYPHQNAVAVDPSGNIHAVYYTTEFADYPICYAKSTNGGATWSDTILTQTTGMDFYRPTVACDSAGNVHVGWYVSTAGTTPEGIYYKKYDAGTSTWGPDTVLYTSGTYNQYYPHIVCRPGRNNVHVVWQNNEPAYPSYYQAAHIEYTPGSGWGVVTQVSQNTADYAYDISCAVDSNDNVYVVWAQDTAVTSTYEIIWYRSRIGGSWGPIERVSPVAMDGDYNYDPFPAVSANGDVHVVWERDPVGSTAAYDRIYYCRRDFTTGLWGTVDTISYDVSTGNHYSYDAKIWYDGTDLHTCWQGYGLGTTQYQVIYRKLDGTTYTWGAIEEATTHTSGSLYEPHMVAEPDGTVHIAYRSYQTGVAQIWYVKGNPPANYDAAMQAVISPAGMVAPGATVTCSVQVYNAGLLALSSIPVAMTISTGGSPVYTGSATYAGPLASGATCTLALTPNFTVAASPTLYDVEATVNHASDQNRSNDTLLTQFMAHQPHPYYGLMWSLTSARLGGGCYGACVVQDSLLWVAHGYTGLGTPYVYIYRLSNLTVKDSVVQVGGSTWGYRDLEYDPVADVVYSGQESSLFVVIGANSPYTTTQYTVTGSPVPTVIRGLSLTTDDSLYVTNSTSNGLCKMSKTGTNCHQLSPIVGGHYGIAYMDSEKRMWGHYNSTIGYQREWAVFGPMGGVSYTFPDIDFATIVPGFSIAGATDLYQNDTVLLVAEQGREMVHAVRLFPFNVDVAAVNINTDHYTNVVGVANVMTGRIRNNGLVTQTSIPVAYNAGAGYVNETWSGSLPQGSETDHVFATTWTPALDGQFPVVCTTGLAGDENPVNNAIIKILDVFIAGTKVGQLFNDNLTWPPPGWATTILSGTYDWQWYGGVRYPSGGYPTVEGAGLAMYPSFSASSGQSARLLSHGFTVSSPGQMLAIDFWMFHDNGYSSSNDRVIIEYTTDSTNFTAVDSFSRYDAAGDAWAQHNVNLGAFVGGTRVHVGLRAVSAYGNDLHVDSLRIYGVTVPNDDVGVTAITPLGAPLYSGNPYTIQVELTNFGVNTQTGFDVSYDPGDGSGEVTEAWTGSLPGFGGTALYSFTTQYTPAVLGGFTFAAYTELTGDGNNGNDTTYMPTTVCPGYYYPPYLKDFNEAWTNSLNPPFCGWQIHDGGDESPAVVNGNDWSNYLSTARCNWSPVENQDDSLISPRFNCLAAGTYTLEYWQNFNWYSITPDSDTGWVYLSTDGGATWPVTVALYAAMDSTANESFDVTADVSGYDNVRFMFRYKAYDDMYFQIDDFELDYVPYPPTLTSPLNGATVGTGTPEFFWNQYAGASLYRLQVDDDPAFGSPAIDDATLTDSSYQVVTALPEGHYYWRAAVEANTVWSGWSAVWEFDITLAPSWPYGWVEMKSMPTGTEGKAVKRGGWLAPGPELMDGFDVIYAAKGYKTNEFYKYYVDGDSWVDVVGMPYETHPEWYKKAPRKGSKGCSDGADYIYVTQGNNSLGFWRLAMDGDSWEMLRDVPEGPYRKKVKGGTDMAYMVVNDTGYVYLLKGYKTEFYRYNTELDEWEELTEAPAGTRAKWDKGSWLVAEGPDAEVIYAHKAKYHEMYRYYVDGDSWGPDMGGLPFIGMSGRRKKSKDGGSAAWYENTIYALKGGNTQEFWKYEIGDSWKELDTMPSNGSTGRKKRVKYGADIVSYGFGAFFALKGNKTLEYWRYYEMPTVLATRPQRSGVMAQPTGMTGLGLTLAPNPLSGGFVTLRYTLPAAGPASINVVDVAGRTVERQTVYASRTGAVNLDLRNLSAGVYLVRFETDGFETTRKLVVQ